MYVITGATGNTGRKITEHLLAEGKKVRAIGRSASNLQPLAEKGAEILTGSMEDKDFLTSAFKGAFAVYALIPPNMTAERFRTYQNQVGESILSALKATGIEFIVNLSSLGAHLSEKTGVILGLYDQEQRLNDLKGVNIVHLRPAYFMENLLGGIPLIKSKGINGSPLRGDLAIPVIATQDIAKVAGEYLLNLDFKDVSVRELLGQRDLSMNEMTRLIGQAIGIPDLPYVQVPYEEAEKFMIETGLSPDAARLLIELQKGINEGIVIAETPRTDENTTGTSFEEFSKIFAAIYKSG